MEDFDIFIPPQKVSYLQARDPSILSWNRHGIDKVRHNLVNDFESESTLSSVPSEKEDNHIKVYLRLKNAENYRDVYSVEDDNLVCKVPEGSHSARNQDTIKKYEFTRIFGPETGQQELFNQIIKPKILDFINGHNSTLMAYGSSGSGKTFTMVGTAEQPGIIPRALEYLFRSIPPMSVSPHIKPLWNGKVIALNEFEREVEQQKLQSILPSVLGERSMHIRTYRAMQQRLSNNPVATVEHSPPILSVYVSFAEIYNEFVYDLLEQPPKRGQQRPKLKIGGPQDHIYIKDLKYIYVKSGLEAYQVLQYGINNLKYADTAVNMHSSRSHCIFTIRLVQGYDAQNSLVSTFNFCDLAGSERLKKTLNVGDRLKESNNINSSLLVLGRCISIIRDEQSKKEKKVPPFRESKLTQLFQRALMGKEGISMIVNINPSRDMFDETQQTLNFAGIAKELTIDERPPHTLNPSRFSSRFCRDGLPHITENEREEEMRELRDRCENLSLEMSLMKQEQEETLEAERQHLRNCFEELIEMRNVRIKKLEKENKELKKQVEERQREVIVLSDEDSDEESEQIEDLKRENSELQEQLRKAKNKISRLDEELAEANLTMEDAKNDFKFIYTENTRLRKENRDLKIELINLKDEFDLQKMEVESLRDMTILDRENIEKLEDENRSLMEQWNLDTTKRLSETNQNKPDANKDVTYKTDNI